MGLEGELMAFLIGTVGGLGSVKGRCERRGQMQMKVKSIREVVVKII